MSGLETFEHSAARSSAVVSRLMLEPPDSWLAHDCEACFSSSGRLEPADLVRDGSVPHGVQVVVAGLVPANGDLVATALHVLDVQRLVDVADEVQDKLEGLLAQGRAGTGVDEGGCLLVDGRHDTALFLFAAVGRVLYAAFTRGGVAGIWKNVSLSQLDTGNGTDL